jgi:hypothetical protein
MVMADLRHLANRLAQLTGKRRRLTPNRRMGEGKIALKVEALLDAEGFTVDSFWFQLGGYRTAMWDLASWGAQGYWKDMPAGFKTSVHSWDTMTQCTKRGIRIDRSDRCDCEVHAKARD